MRKIITRLVTISVIVAALGGTASGKWIRKGAEISSADQRNMELQKSASQEDLWTNGDYWRDPAEWMRNWRATVRKWRGLPFETIRWGREKRAIKSRLVILEPALPKTSPPGKVQVEWFHSPLDERGSSNVWWGAGEYTLQWSTSVMNGQVEGKRNPVVFEYRLVGKGPLLMRRYNAQRRAAQEIVYAWGNMGDGGGEGLKAYLELIKNSKDSPTGESALIGIASRWSGEKIIESAGLSVEEWRRRIDLPETQRRIRETDERYKTMMTRAAEKSKNILRTPQDPILLIDGRYLLTGPVTGRVKDQFRMANWIIRELIEEMPQHGFKLEDIQWGNERRPKRGEIIELKKPFEQGERMTVEWAHTYISAQGQTIPVEWLERVWRDWARSLEAAGIEKPQMRRIALVNNKGSAREHQIVHREATIAWGPPLPQRRNLIHVALAKHLATDPLGLGSHEAVGNLLDAEKDMSQEVYDAVRTSASRTVLLEQAKAKGEAIQRAVAGRKERTDPIFLVNGKYVVVTKDATRTFQVLNWLVGQIGERR